MLADPRYPDWIGPTFRPPLEVWWTPTLVAAVLALLALVAVAWWPRDGGARWRVGAALVLGLLGTAGVAWATRRYPPPVWTFTGHEAHPVVVVVISEDAPRRPDFALDFATSCALAVHPADFKEASNQSPWSTYPGEFPLAQTDDASNGEGGALAFATGGRGPAPLRGAQVHAAVEECGSDAARSAWDPPTLLVRGATELWVVIAMDPDAPRSTRTVEVDARGRCGVVIDAVAPSDLRVVFVDERGAPLAGHQMGLLRLEIGETASASHFLARPSSTGASALSDASDSWESCLARSPDLQVAWR